MSDASSQVGAAAGAVTETESDFSALLNKEFRPKSEQAKSAVESAVRTLAEHALRGGAQEEARRWLKEALASPFAQEEARTCPLAPMSMTPLRSSKMPGWYSAAVNCGRQSCSVAGSPWAWI